MDVDQITNCSLFSEDKKEDLFKFLHMCINEICNCPGPTFQKFKSIGWTEEEFNNVHKLFLKLFQNPSCLYVEEEKMPLEYHDLPEYVRGIFSTCIKARRNQLTNNLLHKYSSKYIPTLCTFDWRLKYVMGSSKMASIRETLLQLDLVLSRKQKENICALELNEEELDILINALEDIAI